MTGVQLFEAIGMIDDEYITAAAQYRTGFDAETSGARRTAGRRLPVRKAAVCLAAAVLLLLASFTVAMAVSYDFRERVYFILDEDLKSLRDGAVPAEEPEVCDGFGGLLWGSPTDKLPEASETEIVRYSVPVAGYNASAYYTFDRDGRLFRGRYVLNDYGTLDRPDILETFLAVRHDLKIRFGAPADIVRGENSASSVEELIEAGGGTYTEMWAPVPTSDGKRVDIALTLQPNGTIDVTYYYSGHPMPTQEPQPEAADGDYTQVVQMLADLAEAGVPDPAQYESAQLSLSNWADSLDKFGVIRLCSDAGDYAGTHELSYSQVLSLLMVKKDFDGATTEAYTWLLNQLYEYHPAQFVSAAMYCIDQYNESFIRDYLDYYLTNEKTGASLEREYNTQNSILANLRSYLSQSLEIADIPAGVQDMDLHFFNSALPVGVTRLIDGALPVYAVDIPRSGDTLRLYFDNKGTLIAYILTDAMPAADRKVCDGFDGMTWGSTADELPEEAETHIVRRGASFAGHYGTAFYTFDRDGCLVQGRYAFNESSMLSWYDALKAFLTLRNGLTARYGATDSKPGAAIPYSPEALIKTGSHEWSEVWNGVPFPDGRTMAISLELWANGLIELRYFGGKPAQPQKADTPPVIDESAGRIERPVPATAPSGIERHALDTGETAVEVRYSPGPGMKTGVVSVAQGTFESIEADVRDLFESYLPAGEALPVYRIAELTNEDGKRDETLLFTWLRQEAYDFLDLAGIDASGMSGECIPQAEWYSEPQYLLQGGQINGLSSRLTSMAFHPGFDGWSDAGEGDILSILESDSFCRAAAQHLGITDPAVMSRVSHTPYESSPEEKSFIIYQSADNPVETMYNIAFRSIRLSGLSGGSTLLGVFKKASSLEYVGDGAIRPYEDAVSEAVSVYGVAEEDILAYDIGYYNEITPGYFIPCYRFIVNTHGQYFHQAPDAPEPELMECIDILVPAVELG